MVNLGENLRRAREQRGVNLSQAALETRIRQSVLESLEEGDYSGLPPRPFLRGLLRNYAVYLNLDPDVVLEEYDLETGFKPEPPRFETGKRTPSQPAEAEPYPPRRDNAPPAERYARPESSLPPFSPVRQPANYTPAVPPSAPEQPETGSGSFPPFRLPGKSKQASPGPRQEQEFSGARSAERPLRDQSEPVVEIVPESESPEAQLSGDRGQVPGEPPTLAQRIGATRIPEVVAILSLAVALFGLISIGTKQVSLFSLISLNQAAAPTATPSPTPAPGSSPTAVPTLAETLNAETTAPLSLDITESPTAEPTSAPALPTPTLDVPTDAQMTLEISADAPMFVWAIVDNREAFNGEMQNQTLSWTARERTFLQVKTIGNGRVFFNGRRILPRVQEERFDLQRAWQMSPQGTPVAVRAEPFPLTPTATSSPTPLPTDTPTVTPTSTLTLTSTATMTPSQTATASVTPTSSATSTATASSTPTGTASQTATSSSILTASSTATPTETASSTVSATATPTETASSTVSATATPTPTSTSSGTPVAPPANATWSQFPLE